MHSVKKWLVCILLMPAMSAAADKPLRIYLPQETQITGTTASLGSVGILLGDPALVAQAQAVSLGSFSTPGQILQVDRHTLLSRLATVGIKPHQVQFLGAEIMSIGRNEMTLSADQITSYAQRYLEGRFAEAKDMTITMIRPPQPVVLDTSGGAAELSVEDDSIQNSGVRKIRVGISQGGRPVGSQEVYFTVRYAVRRLIAVTELPAGTTLSRDNVRVETVQSDQPEPESWAVPYGMVTRHRIAANGTVSDTQLETPQAPIVVHKRQAVPVRIDNGLLLVSATGEALDDGAVGQIIRVRRGQRPQERIITCRIRPDGSAEPVY